MHDCSWIPADPPTVVAVMRCAGDQQHGLRSRALIVMLWRAGLRVSEALSLAESDLDPRGVPLNVIQGNQADLGITSIHLRGEFVGDPNRLASSCTAMGW